MTTKRNRSINQTAIKDARLRPRPPPALPLTASLNSDHRLPKSAIQIPDLQGGNHDREEQKNKTAAS